VWLGGIVGAILGFVIGVLITEVIFDIHESWSNAVAFGLAVVGMLAGSAVGRRFANRNVGPS
jgi:uncharacterized protein YqgC (DUF456 family)